MRLTIALLYCTIVALVYIPLTTTSAIICLNRSTECGRPLWSIQSEHRSKLSISQVDLVDEFLNFKPRVPIYDFCSTPLDNDLLRVFVWEVAKQNKKLLESIRDEQQQRELMEARALEMQEMAFRELASAKESESNIVQRFLVGIAAEYTKFKRHPSHDKIPADLTSCNTASKAVRAKLADLWRSAGPPWYQCLWCVDRATCTIGQIETIHKSSRSYQNREYIIQWLDEVRERLAQDQKNVDTYLLTISNAHRELIALCDAINIVVLEQAQDENMPLIFKIWFSIMDYLATRRGPKHWLGTKARSAAEVLVHVVEIVRSGTEIGGRELEGLNKFYYGREANLYTE